MKYVFGHLTVGQSSWQADGSLSVTRICFVNVVFKFFSTSRTASSTEEALIGTTLTGVSGKISHKT
jgi:hypothetical protein